VASRPGADGPVYVPSPLRGWLGLWSRRYRARAEGMF
jgi:hypothetical protein